MKTSRRLLNLPAPTIGIYVIFIIVWMGTLLLHAHQEVTALCQIWQNVSRTELLLLEQTLAPAFQRGNLMDVQQTVGQLDILERRGSLFLIDSAGMLLAQSPNSRVTDTVVAQQVAERVTQSQHLEALPPAQPYKVVYGVPLTNARGHVGATLVLIGDWHTEYRQVSLALHTTLWKTGLMVLAGMLVLLLVGPRLVPTPIGDLYHMLARLLGRRPVSPPSNNPLPDIHRLGQDVRRIVATLAAQQAELQQVRDRLEVTVAECMQALHTAREYTNHVINGAHTLIICLDRDGKVRVFNTAAEQITGYRHAEIQTQNWFDLLVPHHLYPDVWEKLHTGTIRQNLPRTFDSPIRTREGNERYISWQTRPLHEQDNGMCTIVFGIDITEHRQRERELENLIAVAHALRSATTRTQMLPIILDQAITLLGAAAGALVLRDPASGETVVEYAYGAWSAIVRSRFPPTTGTVSTLFAIPCPLHPVFWQGVVSVPLLTHGYITGALWLGREAAITDTEYRFLSAIADMTANALQRADLVAHLQHSNEELSQAYDALIASWSRFLELRDKETQGHSQRVTGMAVELAQAMGLVDAELTHIRHGALLHDIGKMGIPDAILHKPGPLTAAEWELMRMHPVYAYELLAPISYLRPALDIPYCHHEKWDGSGYPCGIQGNAIPLAARIFAVVDVYDALCSERPYHAAWTESAALDYIQEQAGTQFDPQVVTAFLKYMQRKHVDPVS